MGQVYRFLGMEVGLIQNGMRPDKKIPAYQADVTYGTNSEFGFDYLRDNMVTRADAACSAAIILPSSTRSTPSSSTRPHAADHLRRWHARRRYVQ